MDDLYSYGDAMVYAQVEDGVLNEDALEDHHTYRDMYRDILLGKVKS